MRSRNPQPNRDGKPSTTTRAARCIFLLLILNGLSLVLTAQVRFCAVGDVLLDRGVRTIIEANDAGFPFRNSRDMIASHDLALCNLECPVADSLDGYPLNKRYSFRAEPGYLEGLKYGGFNLVSLANNHTIDYGKEGLMQTIACLNQASMYCFGAGENQVEAFKPLIVYKNGIRFAFFSVLEFLLEATSYNADKPYPAYGRIEYLCELISRYDPIVDHVIVSFHWGEENQSLPSSRQKAYAHRVIDAGADLVLGHHPHVLQRIETYRNKPVLYSLGNFVFDQTKETQQESVVFSCTFQGKQMKDPILIPVKINDHCPEPASPETGKKIFRRLEKISQTDLLEWNAQTKNITIRCCAERPVKELVRQEPGFAVYPKEILVLQDDSILLTYSMPDQCYRFRDACLLEEEGILYIYAIVEKPGSGQSRVAVFPYHPVEKTFLQPSLDEHVNLNPWKIDIWDVDLDGTAELILGVEKSTRYDEHIRKRIFVYNREKDYIYPKWLGSKLGNPLVNYAIDRTTNRLLVLENSLDSQSRILVAYRWNGFGFDNEEIVMTGLTEADREIVFLMDGVSEVFLP